MLPSQSVSGADELLRVALSELRRRLQAGEPCRAETLLDAYPTLASHSHHALDLVVAEFLVRQELGQHPDPQEWFARFPQWRDDLRRQFDLLQSDGSVRDLDTAAEATKSDDRPTLRFAAPEHTPALTPHELLEPIAHGGMGVVFKARDLVLDRLVALKMIHAGAHALPESVERFYREARAAARLRHPNILPIHGMGLHGGQHCFTMPLITGGSLAQHLADYKQDPRKAVALLEKVARAVHAAHEAGIIHRDLKPGNILLDDAGEPLVSDFGLAKLNDPSAEMTLPGQTVGTPAYMSPEQAAGQNDRVTAASDVWALGVILYELLAGRRPFPGRSKDEVMPLVLKADPPRLRSLRPDLPRELEGIIARCLERDPGQRYASAAALADDLRSWLDGRPIRSRPLSWSQRLRQGAFGHPLWCLAGLLLLPLGAVALLPSHRTGPDHALTALKSQLARHEPATLVGRTGPPSHFRWITAKSRATQDLRRDGTFAIQTMSLAMLELVPDQPLRSFRFRAEVQQYDNAGNGCAGLYLLHRRTVTPRGVEDFACDLTFNALGKNPPRNVSFTMRRYWEGVGWGSKNTTSPLHYEQLAPPPAGKTPPEGQWHPLAVVVTPTTIRAFYDGRMVYAKERGIIPARVPWLFDFKPLPPGLPPLFPAEGGLGLFVYRGAAAYRNVVLEPLAENQADFGPGQR